MAEIADYDRLPCDSKSFLIAGIALFDANNIGSSGGTGMKAG
jgi:hypothetical protein